MADYRLYDVTVSTLTPLHIGNGRELLNEYDYAIRDGRTWRINENALLDSYNVDDLALADRLAETPPAELLPQSAWDPDGGLFRYVIQGAPRSNAEGAKVREQIKDAYDHPYLPGSSLKGALRTALGWYIWGMKKLDVQPSALEGNPKTAARQVEKGIFGQDPNHDLLRVLQVSDSSVVTSDALMVANVSVLRRNGEAAAPIELEALGPGVSLSLRIKVDLALYSKWASALGFEHRGLLLNLPQVVQRRSKRQIRTALTWAQQLPNGDQLVDRYAMLQRIANESPEHRCVLQLGWATGWDDKTFGSHLLGSPALSSAMFRSYNLVRRGQYNPAHGFPTTRRVEVDVQESRSGRRVLVPRRPLGWCILEFKERKG